jgi:hypothetical protein
VCGSLWHGVDVEKVFRLVFGFCDLRFVGFGWLRVAEEDLSVVVTQLHSILCFYSDFTWEHRLTSAFQVQPSRPCNYGSYMWPQDFIGHGWGGEGAVTSIAHKKCPKEPFGLQRCELRCCDERSTSARTSRSPGGTGSNTFSTGVATRRAHRQRPTAYPGGTAPPLITLRKQLTDPASAWAHNQPMPPAARSHNL